MTVTDKIVPGMVGVDIGCGMETVKIAEKVSPVFDSTPRPRSPDGGCRSERPDINFYPRRGQLQ